MKNITTLIGFIVISVVMYSGEDPTKVEKLLYIIALILFGFWTDVTNYIHIKERESK